MLQLLDTGVEPSGLSRLSFHWLAHGCKKDQGKKYTPSSSCGFMSFFLIRFQPIYLHFFLVICTLISLQIDVRCPLFWSPISNGPRMLLCFVLLLVFACIGGRLVEASFTAALATGLPMFGGALCWLVRLVAGTQGYFISFNFQL